MSSNPRFLRYFLRVLLILAPTTAFPQVCVPAPDGLVGWWSGDATAEDIEGVRDGVLQGGASFGSGLVGQGFLFDGVDDFVGVGDLGLLGDWTVDFWIQLNDLPVTTCCQQGPLFYPIGIADNSLQDSPGIFVSFRTEGDRWGLYEGAPGKQLLFGSPLNSVGEWNHLAVTKQGLTYRLYRNGGLEATGSFGADLTIPLFNIGRRSDDFFYVDGVIDEVEVFNRTLSASEIQAIYDAGPAGKCKDEDGDGFRPPNDCDETSAAINPNAVELPGNFVDENCNGDLGACNPCLTWRNHGEYVRCVGHDVDALVTGGAITQEEGDALVGSAAASDIGKKGFAPPECQ